MSVAFVKPVILHENLSNAFGLTTRYFLTETIIYSFNNNALKKYTKGKAFNIVATQSKNAW